MTNKINGINVSEYFIDVVDEGGSTIDYKILPNSERLLVEKIFEQNQQLKRLQEENKRLQMLSCANCGEKYLSPDGAELYEKNVQLQKENEKIKTYIQKMDKPQIKTIDSEIALKNIELQKENEELKKQLEFLRTHKTVLDAERIKYKQDLEEIREHIKGLEKLLFENTYADDTKRLIMVELQSLRAVLEDNKNVENN